METHVLDAATEEVVRHGVCYAQRAVRVRKAAAAARERAKEGGWRARARARAMPLLLHPRPPRRFTPRTRK